jgi:uncharacterized protein DUF4231
MVRYWDQRSRKSRRKYFAYRTIVLIGGVLIPALVSLQTSNLVADNYKGLIQFAAIVTGLLIAIAAGVEEIFHYGEIWREKRKAAELLKIEGWRYFQLAGPLPKSNPQGGLSRLRSERRGDDRTRDQGLHGGHPARGKRRRSKAH